MTRPLLALALLAVAAASAAQPAGAPGPGAPGLDGCLDRVEPYAAGEPGPADDETTVEWAGPAGGALRYVGVRHTRNAADPQVEAVAAAFRAFRPTVAYVEGPARPIGTTADETVRQTGESGLVRWLAAEAGVEVRRLDPAHPADEFAAVAAAVGAERAALFFVLREAARLRDREGLGGADLDAAVGALLTRAAPLGLPVGTLAELEAATARQLGAPTDWRAAPAAWFDPGADDAVTGGVFMAEANRASSHARDRYMARELAGAVRSGERAFAVVGRNHVPKQAPALRCALQAP